MNFHEMDATRSAKNGCFFQRRPDSNARCHSLRSGVGIFTRVERSEGGEIEGKGPTDRSRFDRPVKD